MSEKTNVERDGFVECQIPITNCMLAVMEFLVESSGLDIDSFVVASINSWLGDLNSEYLLSDSDSK